ncbi:MAG: hypothetical protein R3A52_10710 [Polyangiales bacterium]
MSPTSLTRRRLDRSASAALLVSSTLAALAPACTRITGMPPDAEVPVSRGGLAAEPDLRWRYRWGESTTATSAMLGSDGHVFVSAGAAVGTFRDLALTRFTAAGAEAFTPGAGDDGFTRAVARYEGARLQSVPRAMARDRAGRWITAGNGLLPGRRYGLVARWLPDGSLDTSFGASGVAVVPSPGGDRDVILRGVLVEDDGAVVVVGADTIPLLPAAAGVYARVDAQGSLDAAFAGGVAVDPRVAGFDAVVHDADGYALLGESITDGSPLALYLGPDGRPRADVGDAGLVAFPSSAATRMVVRAAVRSPDGGIIVAGGSGPHVVTGLDAGVPSGVGVVPIQLVRFTARREPDLTWGTQGVSRDFSSSTTWNLEMTLNGGLLPFTDESVLVLGEVVGDTPGYRVYRVLRDGRPDPDFGVGGFVGELVPDLQYPFDLRDDGAGGAWVFYRAASERELGAAHFPRAR